MFGALRWRLSVQFLALSALVYAGLSLCFLAVFRLGLTASIDEELKALCSEIRPAIAYRASRPTLEETWAASLKARSIKLQETIQLYDPAGTLLESYGPSALRHLVPSGTEISTPHSNVRTRSHLLVAAGGKAAGTLQIQLSTARREHAIRHLSMAALWLAPLVLLSLAACSYYFAGRAVRPVEESFKTLRQFMSDAGHELNTPISIVQVNAEALQQELIDEGINSSTVDVILRASERMQRLVSDLSFLAKMERPELLEPPQLLQVDKLARDLLEEFSRLYREKGVKLITGELTPAKVQGYPEALKRMISNLLQNALRYTDQGGSVTLAVTSDGGQATICLTDTGIGIPAQCLPHIFERFYRVDSSRSRQEGGSGLGLSIVQAIAHRHQGSVKVKSTPGEGSTFTIALPLSG